MGFAHPDWAPAVLGVAAALALLAALAAWRARRRLARIGAGALGAGGGRDALLLAALAAIGLALLGPRLGTRMVDVPVHGIDVVDK